VPPQAGQPYRTTLVNGDPPSTAPSSVRTAPSTGPDVARSTTRPWRKSLRVGSSGRSPRPARAWCD
jgi:hypothetical protein